MSEPENLREQLAALVDELEREHCTCGAENNLCQPGTWEFCGIHKRIATLRGAIESECSLRVAAAIEKAAQALGTWLASDNDEPEFIQSAMGVIRSLISEPAAKLLEAHDQEISREAYLRCAAECPDTECEGAYEVFACEVKKVFLEWANESTDGDGHA
jgi:hypothetical protein